MTTQLTQDLKPCPFCGNPTPFWRRLNRNQFYIKCGVCYALSGEYEDKEAAFDAWNKRPASEIEAVTAERDALLAETKWQAEVILSLDYQLRKTKGE